MNWNQNPKLLLYFMQDDRFEIISYIKSQPSDYHVPFLSEVAPGTKRVWALELKYNNYIIPISYHIFLDKKSSFYKIGLPLDRKHHADIEMFMFKCEKTLIEHLNSWIFYEWSGITKDE